MKPPPFDGRAVPIPAHFFAAGRADCATWKDIIGTVQGGKYATNIDFRGPCVQAEPLDDPERFLTVGEVVFVLDEALTPSSVSTEFVKGGQRYYLVRINPNTANFKSLAHELRHLVWGHTAIRWSPLSDLVANAFLDILIEPYELWGNDWPSATATTVFIAFLLCWWSIRRSASTKESGTAWKGTLGL